MYTSDFSEFLKPAEIDAIFEQTRRKSVVQQLARQVTMGQHGTNIPVWTGKPTAGFVDEGAVKPTSEVSATVKKMVPHKIAVIVPVSAELVRANPLGVIQHAQADMVEALAVAFDNAVLHGVNSPYANDLSDVTQTAEMDTNGAGAYASFNGILRTLVTNGKKLTGFALDSVVEPDLNIAVDGTGKSIFVESATDVNDVVRQGRLLGRPTFLSDNLKNAAGTIVGFAGDWSQIIWGQVAAIQVDVTDQATIELSGAGGTLNLWQRNMLALRAEVEYGVLINDLNSFVKIQANDPATPAA
ncbi:phage major capsid protein [Saccharopolyspora erythraea]|uniref:phage major capsid protein n=1 Tax=Saccharopolyspora erythraea TaxID=1836 RepID=UPI001BA8E5E4|nr:phage major capsid protein [Saccharopolyspora erythraea]QUH01456.1 phage major capsid protein [Saccharopolyspora erythraea]